MVARALTLTLALLASACTLDFDEFAEFTTEPDVNFVDDSGPTDRGVGQDRVIPPDMGDGGPVPDIGGGEDGDADGIADGQDNCPEVPNPDQADFDMDGEGDACDPDDDGDGANDDVDNCPGLMNPAQLDLDRDGQGDDCDDDADGDSLDAATEAMRGTDPTRPDTDGDGVADGVDLCPLHPSRVAVDTDMDGAGDACDPDDDGDGILDYRDNCPGTSNPDQADAEPDGVGDACALDYDGDAVPNDMDNCPRGFNPDQAIDPCAPAFANLGYTREGLSVYRTGDGVIGGTVGGALIVAGEAVTSLTNADRLVGNRVHASARDGDGRTWMATDRGLAVLRPDGFVFAQREGDVGGGPRGNLRDLAISSTGVWLSSDEGLNLHANNGWNFFSAELPDTDVRGLHLDGMERLWAATAGGVVRITEGMPAMTLAGLPDVGAFNAVTGDGADGYWLGADNGAIHLAADDSVIASFTDFEAHAIAPAARGAFYFGTPEGVRRLDADGRLFEAGAGVLPGPEVRDLDGAADAPRWAATNGGVVAVDGYFSQLPVAAELGGGCITHAVRAGDSIWVGTEAGLLRQTPDGALAAVAEGVPPGRISVIRPIGEWLWVGTENGIGVLNAADGTPTAQYLVGDENVDVPDAPITDVVEGNPGDVWVSTDGAGIARLDAEGVWRTFNQEAVGNNFLANEVTVLAHGDNRVWAGTELGLTNFNENTQSFEAPITRAQGRLPDARIQDVVAGGGYVFAGTPAGVAVRDPEGRWASLNRANFAWPQSVGSDLARAVAFDGANLWIAFPASRTQEFGSVVRRPLDAPPDDASAATVFLSDDGITRSAGRGGAAIEYRSGELFFSYCGDAEAPGGLTVLDGGGVVTRDLSDIGLPSDAEGAWLTIDHTGRPLFSANVRGGSEGFSIGPEGELTRFALPPNTPAPSACDIADGEASLWCIVPGAGLARRVGDAQWSPIDLETIRALGEGDLRDIVAIGASTVWVAAATGVVLIDQGNVMPLNEARGLPSNDVRSIDVGPDGRLYAATAAGLAIYDRATMEFEIVGPGALRNSDVRSVAVGPDGTAWIGTADGLFRRDNTGLVAEFDVRSGLSLNRINAVELHPDGRVFVATDLGLAVGTGQGDFTQYGFVDGLPGDAVHDVVIAPDGLVWVRSDDGVARLLR